MWKSSEARPAAKSVSPPGRVLFVGDREAIRSALSALRQVGRHLVPFEKRLLLAALLGVLTIGSGIGLLAFAAYLLAKAALRPPLAELAVAILCVRLFGIGRGVWRYLERLVSHDVTFRFLARLRLWFYRSLMPLVPAQLQTRASAQRGKHTTGDMLSRFVADIETLQELASRALIPWLVALVIGSAMYLVLNAYHRQLALLFLAFYLLASLGIPLLSFFLSKRLEQRIVNVRSRLNTALVESVQGMADLLAFGRAEDQQGRVCQWNRQLIRLQTGQAGVEALREALTLLLTDGCVWTLLLLTIPLVYSGQVDGVFLACILLAALGSFEAVRPLTTAAQRFGGCLEATRRLTEIVEMQPAESPAAPAVQVTPHFTLDVRNLSFRYAQAEPLIVQHVSFTVPQGRCVAIVGPSGSGKSTLAHLLLRFWNYSQGSITLGGHELNTFRQEDLLRWIGILEQQVYFFNATVRENLLLARPEASQGEIEQAARQAMIHEVIQALPQGYETRIGEQGFRLSGGERQRLALARTLLKDAPVLLLDEPTAHLDALTEQALLRSLRTSIQGRTTVLITHRLVGLEMADEILVLEHGQMRERGSHDELLQAEGLYWRYWTLQNQLLKSVSDAE